MKKRRMGEPLTPNQAEKNKMSIRQIVRKADHPGNWVIGAKRSA